MQMKGKYGEWEIEFQEYNNTWKATHPDGRVKTSTVLSSLKTACDKLTTATKKFQRFEVFLMAGYGRGVHKGVVTSYDGARECRVTIPQEGRVRSGKTTTSTSVRIGDMYEINEKTEAAAAEVEALNKQIADLEEKRSIALNKIRAAESAVSAKLTAWAKENGL